MPDHVIKLTLDAFNECKKPVKNSKILVMGISYKPNVKDIQLSPAKEIIKKFQNLGSLVHIYDPFFSSTEIFGLKVEDNFENILERCLSALPFLCLIPAQCECPAIILMCIF